MGPKTNTSRAINHEKAAARISNAERSRQALTTRVAIALNLS
jgi:hypothetical protein